MINSGEIKFFESIKDNCKVIFDIGCREDIYYVENSEGKELHLFEPNFFSFNNCKDIINNFIEKNGSNLNTIYLYNFGIGNISKSFSYYLDTQSIFKRHDYPEFGFKPCTVIIKRFSEFLKEKNIEFIDFLKIDTEGCEPDILLDDIKFIKTKVKYVQFEWASTWFARDNKMDFVDIFNEYTNNFEFYFLYDEDHPLSNKYKEMLSPIDTQECLEEIKQKVIEDYGLNIVMIKRGINK